MIKQFIESFRSSLAANKSRNELQTALFEASTKHLQEGRGSGYYEKRDTQQKNIPGSHDDFFELPSTEQEMIDILDKLQIVAQSPFAKSLLENRVNYILGSGFTYTATPKDESLQERADKVQEVIDAFLIANRWHKRQEEIIKRQDRDGEVFLRFFEVDADDGFLQVRFIDPRYIVHPEGSSNPNWSWGILTDGEDVEKVEAYHIDTRADGGGKSFKETIDDPESVQHRKLNTDASRKRGFSTLGPIRKNIERTDVILRNAGAVTTIQSAIAMIRKHGSTDERIKAFSKSAQVGTSPTGVPQMYYPPASIIDTTEGTEYEMPATGVDPTKITGIMQAELRAIGASVNMPEYMISSDASNANYSSTLVSEGPFVRSIQRLQRDAVMYDHEIINKVLENAVTEGALLLEDVDAVNIDIEAPDLIVRDEKQKAEIAKITTEAKLVSKKRAARAFGVEDFEAEQEQIEREDSVLGDMVAQNPLNF